MPTNEERHDVAARLRDIGVKTWHTSWHELYAIKNACGCYIGQDQQDVELKDRLADLIEPEERTCTFSECWDDDPLPMCSACGWEAEETDCVTVIGGPLFEYDGKFCKECGAKVVEE